jgi:hypothetical protein
MKGDASPIQRGSRLAGDPRRRPAHQIHENHECAIHDFAMPVCASLFRIKTVTADRLPAHSAATCGTTPQEIRHDMGNTGSKRYAFWL